MRLKRKRSSLDIESPRIRRATGLRNGEGRIEFDNFMDKIDHLSSLLSSSQLAKLRHLRPALDQLSELVGLTEAKNKILEIVLYYLQGLQSGGEMMHTAIYGPPGVGKTTLAKILASIYCNLGFLSCREVIVASSADFIGKYLGFTESRVKKLLEKSQGRVLFIDEAYSLGNAGDYSKSALNVLNKSLSEDSERFVCVIAGYKEAIEKDFFSANPGLEGRFPWTITIDGYTAEELGEIFRRLLKKNDWTTEFPTKKLDDFFRENLDRFPCWARDVEKFFFFCKISYSARQFGSSSGQDCGRSFSLEDLENGLSRL